MPGSGPDAILNPDFHANLFAAGYSIAKVQQTQMNHSISPIVTVLLATTMAALTTASCGQPSATAVSPKTAQKKSSTSSLDSRPLISMSFMEPVDAILSTEAHQPLLDYLTARTPFRYRSLFSSESERNVGVLEERLVEISHLGVVSYLEAHQQFGAIPIVKPLNRNGEPISRSVFVTRKETEIKALRDLKGRSLALGSFHSTLSNLVPRFELLRAGIRPEDLGSIERLANDEEVAKTVLSGRLDAGAIEDVVAERFKKKGLRAFHVSGPIPRGPLAIRDDLPGRVGSAIRDALLELDPQGAENRPDWPEEIRYGFQPAADSDYDAVRKMLKNVPTGCSESCHGSS